MKIFNIGSLNIDRTYRVADFVRPGETIKVSSYAEYCGGKGLNQSIAAARAGAEVFHVGAVGMDGSALVEELKNAGACTTYVNRVDAPTGHAVIQVTDAGENDIIICGGANDKVSIELIDRALAAAAPGDIVLLQNETANVGYALGAAKERGLRVVLNPSPINDSLLELDLTCVDLFILNEHEAAALAGMDDCSDSEAVANALSVRYPHAAHMLTLGSRGGRYLSLDAELTCSSYGMVPVDTTAAGDTFCGYFLASLAQGLDISDVLKRASAASAVAITRPGASISIPTALEVDAFMSTHPYPGA